MNEVKVGDILVHYYDGVPCRVEGFLIQEKAVILKNLANHRIRTEKVVDLFDDASTYAHNWTKQSTRYKKLVVEQGDALVHFKGGRYIVKDIAKRTSDGGYDVIYIDRELTQVWTRPLEEMFSYVGGKHDNVTGQLTRFVVRESDI